MNQSEQLLLMKELGTFWYSDASVPQLFERKVIDLFIQKNRTSLPSNEELKAICAKIETVVESISTVKKESETCSKIIEPLLDILGYCEERRGQRRWLFDEQRTLKEDDQTLIPDYTLFANTADHESANRKNSEQYFENVSLILEAKRNGKDLLAKAKTDRKFDDRANDAVSSLSPLSQIRRYVRAANSEFGIVTNGNDWILVSKTSRNYLSTYHIKLFEIVQLAKATEDYSLILYWWLSFSKYFLIADKSMRALQVRSETAHFTNSLEVDLKERLTPVVLDLLNSVSKVSKDKEYLIENKESLILDVVRFIYQILYIGCLEDRNLLPLNNPVYLYKHSLKELFGLIIKEESWRPGGPKTYYIFDHLKRLMSLIASGCKELGNKDAIGEFSVAQNQFIIPSQLKLDDSILKHILKRILETQAQSRQMVSLRALDTIQFGNIYEHILRLEISFNRTAGIFELESLKDKKFERSTAVYTPHHIVEQMVADIVEKIEIESWKDVEALKMVDPCFGSGHFLIELARQFSQKIIDQIDEKEIPIKNHQNRSIAERRQNIQRYLLVNSIFGVDRSGACIDVAKFSIWLSTAMLEQPPLFLDLQLGTGSSLYGVTNIKAASVADRKILKEIAKNRLAIKQAFSTHGANAKFKEISQKKVTAIESLKNDLSDDFSKLNYGYEMTIAERSDIAFRQRPFFWLLEFPEVFLDGGFSVYTTNPPYDQIKSSPSILKFKNGESEIFRLAKMTDLDIKDYTNLFERDSQYSPFQQGYKNLFEGFILLKNKILSKNGYYSLIVPNSILAGAQTSSIRKNLWSDRLMIVREYPEKDSVSKRVFRLRKVACSIVFGQRADEQPLNRVLMEVYPDANDSLPSQVGMISYESSKAIDKDNLPIVLIDPWQQKILDSVSKFAAISLDERDVKEGELNESVNKNAVFNTKKNATVPIYGTNRMDFYYFNFFPKQDEVQYCKLSSSKITSSKKSDLGKQRVAINGIAGANDSRVLCASFVPEGTLFNSNVNYVLVERLKALNIDHHVYAALLNSCVYDKIIRIQKRTNHNSSAMIAALPLFPNNRSTKIDEKSINGKDQWNLKEVRRSHDKKFVLSDEYSHWLHGASKCLREIGILKNEKVFELFSSILSIKTLNTIEQYSISRKLATGSLEVDQFMLQGELRGQAGKKFKDYLITELKIITQIISMEENLGSFVNYTVALAVLSDPQDARKLLGEYNISIPEMFFSLKNIREKLDKIDAQEFDEFEPWRESLSF